jgi:hypothetical protein
MPTSVDSSLAWWQRARTRWIALGVLLCIGVTLLILYLVHASTPGLRVQWLRPKTSAVRRIHEFEAGRQARVLGGATSHEHPDMTIHSLKYALMDVSLSESATLEGTAFNNPRGTITATLQSPTIDYASFHYDAVAQHPEVKWFDMMDQAALDAALNTASIKQGFLSAYLPQTKRDVNGDPYTAPAETTGVFRYLSVNYLMPIRIRAEIRFPDGSRLLTRGSRSVQTGEDLNGFKTFVTVYDGNFHVPAGDTTESEEVIVVMNNGGIWTELAEPIYYNESEAQSYRLTMIYDPYILLRGSHVSDGDASGTEMLAAGGYTNPLIDTTGNQFMIPIMQNVPILLPQSAYIGREIYQISLQTLSASAPEPYQALIIVYYTSDQPDRIKGATLTLMAAAGHAFPMMNPYVPQPFRLSVTSGNLWTLADYAQRPLVSQFERTSSGTVMLHRHETGTSSVWGFELLATAEVHAFTRVAVDQVSS